MLGILCTLLFLYLLAVFARILLSWFPMEPEGPAATIRSVLFGITEPVLGPLRRTIPTVPLGGIQLDLSPIVVVIGIQIIQRIIGC